MAKGLLVDIYEQQERLDLAAGLLTEAEPADVSQADYQELRAKKLLEIPYGPFGELMNKAIFEARYAGIDDSRLAELAESQSPMLPLLITVHPAFAETRLMERAKTDIMPQTLQRL